MHNSSFSWPLDAISKLCKRDVLAYITRRVGDSSRQAPVTADLLFLFLLCNNNIPGTAFFSKKNELMTKNFLNYNYYRQASVL
ncbi:MAG: hypothetical protein A2173_10430 [Planctomycetes bacterium RBG_13_44_8b]|nr:MAG: hypothetical protein A2173_10430 [Planctomycetes bacterium RBG_13_44_8b]